MNIAEQMREYLAKIAGRAEIDALGDTDSLVERGILDSVGMLELIEFIEAEFRVRIDDDEVVPENFESIEKIVGLLERKLA